MEASGPSLISVAIQDTDKFTILEPLATFQEFLENTWPLVQWNKEQIVREYAVMYTSSYPERDVEIMSESSYRAALIQADGKQLEIVLVRRVQNWPDISLLDQIETLKQENNKLTSTNKELEEQLQSHAKECEFFTQSNATLSKNNEDLETQLELAKKNTISTPTRTETGVFIGNYEVAQHCRQYLGRESFE